jgi:hypothetical protein
MVISHFILTCLLFLSYRSFQVAAVPALATPIPKISTQTTSSTSLALIHSIHFGKREPTHPTTSSTKLLGEVLCTRATVTVNSTETLVLTKTHTVTERVVGPTRLGEEKAGSLSRVHPVDQISLKIHVNHDAQEDAIIRRVEERAECTECLTAGVIPAVLNVKTTSTPKATTTSSSTSPALIHSIHFYRRAAPAFGDFP